MLGSRSKEGKCECCSMSAGEPLPYLLNIEEELNFMGPGVILFFYLNKRLLALTLLVSLLFSLYSMITNIVGDNYVYDCGSMPTGPIPFLCGLKRVLCISNKRPAEGWLLAQLILGTVMCLLWALGTRLIRDFGRKKNRDIDAKLDSSSDYYVWIERMPVGQYIEADVLAYMDRLWKLRNDAVPQKVGLRSVQIIYNVQYVRNTLAKMQALGERIAEMYENIDAP